MRRFEKRVKETNGMTKNNWVCYEKKRLDWKVWERREKKVRVCEEKKELEEE